MLLFVSTSFAQKALVNKTKTIDTVYQQNNIKEIIVFNSFGNVDIIRWDNDKLRVVITINVIAWDKEDANRFTEKLIPKTELKINKKGNYYFSTTNDLSNIKNLCNCKDKGIVYAPWFKKNAKVKHYSVNYKIYIPASVNEMTVVNNFGNMSLPDFDGNLHFALRNGNLKAGKLNFTGNVIFSRIRYGKAHIESIGNGKLYLYSCKNVQLDKADNVEIKSEFSEININNGSSLTIKSKSDNYTIGDITAFKGSGNFSDFTIANLQQSMHLQSKSGSVSLLSINPAFSKIDLNGNFSDFNLNIQDLQFRINADLDFTDLSCPESLIPLSKRKELVNSSASFQESAGVNPNGREIIINCSNCNISLNE